MLFKFTTPMLWRLRLPMAICPVTVDAQAGAARPSVVRSDGYEQRRRHLARRSGAALTGSSQPRLERRRTTRRGTKSGHRRAAERELGRGRPHPEPV